MRLYRLRDHGSIDNVELHEAPAPSPGRDQALVRIRAASLNARDLMVILGPSPYGPRPGLVPLSDGAGEVVAVGEGVERVAPGDRVMAAFRQGWISGPPSAAGNGSDLGGSLDGVLAEEILLADEGLVHIPDGLSFEAAATLPCAGVTAWNALRGGTGLSRDHSVLVQGTGGVSLFALQIAVAEGCRVIATTSSPEKADRLRALGAAEVIDCRATPDWDAEVLRLTDGRGVDRIVEVGGAGTLPRSFNAAAMGGEIGLVGLLDNPMGQISPLPIMGKALSLRGVTVGSRGDLEALAAFVARRFDPVIDSIFAFDQARDALRRLASRNHVGKIVLRI